MKLIARIVITILRFFEFLPIIGEPIRVVNINQKIRSLEKKDKLEEAHSIRENALLQVSSQNQGPLLRSEGEDRLYRLKDYQGALEAFEKSMIVMKKSAFLYGVTQSDNVYAGAAQAAVFLSDKDKATKYFDRFVELVDMLSEDKKLEDSLKWHRDTLDWLKHSINTM